MTDAENRRPGQDAIHRLLCPHSVAIIGASPTPGSLGASVLANLERLGYAGGIHLVNPRRAEIGGRPCLSSADELPERVDCAVLAIPGAGVLDALAACARRGVRAAIIFAAGFAEGGPEGRAAQEEIGRIARAHGMAVEGPNCLGMVNYADGVALTFVDTPAARFEGDRGIAIVSQSGAMAAVVGVGLQARDLGLSVSVSTGNEAVTGVEDYVEHLLDDGRTRVVAMVVEQFRQPRRFLGLAREARRRGKLIVLLHPGRSAAARLSAQTHTGAMAGDHQIMRLKVAHEGVAVVDTLEELLDVSELFVRCRSLPQSGAAVLTESGAFKALTLDFCEDVGLDLPALPPGTEAALRRAMPDFIPASNPLDLTAQALVDPGLYRATMAPLLADETYGSLVLGIILTNEATSRHKMPPIIAALEEMRPDKPVVFAALDEGAAVPGEFVAGLRRLGVPFFASPERAFKALARVTRFASSHAGHGPADASVSLPGLRLPHGTVPEHLSKQALAAAGIPVPAGELAKDLAAAQAAAARLGFPVVLKAQSAALSHKSDAGGVVLNLADADALSAGWDRLHANLARNAPGIALDGVLVERMAARGTELIVGARNDPDWGPVVLAGLGGIWAEALRDVRLLPPGLSVEAIATELGKLKGAALLRGIRGSPALDVMAAADIVRRVGMLVHAVPEIEEIDVNPVVLYPDGQGALALDALIVTR